MPSSHMKLAAALVVSLAFSVGLFLSTAVAADTKLDQQLWDAAQKGDLERVKSLL